MSWNKIWIKKRELNLIKIKREINWKWYSTWKFWKRQIERIIIMTKEKEKSIVINWVKSSTMCTYMTISLKLLSKRWHFSFFKLSIQLLQIGSSNLEWLQTTSRDLLLRFYSSKKITSKFYLIEYVTY